MYMYVTCACFTAKVEDRGLVNYVLAEIPQNSLIRSDVPFVQVCNAVLLFDC